MSFTPIFSFGSAGESPMDQIKAVPVAPASNNVLPERSTPRRRTRTTLSCGNCYSAKRRCDRKRPCMRCIELGLTQLCVYPIDIGPGRQPTNLDDRGVLLTRIAELQVVIHSLRSRGQHANRPYEEDTFSENESSSSYGGNRQKKRRGSPSPPAYEQDMDSVVPDADATASSSTAPDSSYVASVSQIDSPVIVSPLAPEPINSDPSGASASLASSHTPTATFTARAYAARFAYPSVCVCAESSVALDAVQRLIGAVRDAAAVFTNLHAEASAEHQCALLGRILELEGFLCSLTAMFTAVALPADVAAVPVGGRNDALLLSPVSMARADRPVGQMPYAPWNGALVGEMSFHRSFDAAAGALGEGIGGPDPSY